MKRSSSEYYIYQTADPQRGGLFSRLAVVFCSGVTLSADALFAALREHMETNPAPSQILLVAGEYVTDALVSLAQNEFVRNGLPGITRYLSTPPLIPLVFRGAGSLLALDHAGETYQVDSHSARLRHAGLQSIFKRYGGILDPGAGFHYVKPSGKHAQQFVRTGNVLLSSAEINFIAFCLLPWAQGPVRHIYTDTASINSVAYAFALLRKLIEPTSAIPTIDSYSSYAGIPSFVMERGADSLYLVSASTSGDLADEIASRHLIPRDRIVTLYYCADEPSQSPVLCDLTRTQENPDGIDPIVSYADETRCKLCQENSIPITISGDQFLPAEPETVPVMITAADAPSWLTSAVDQLAFRSALRSHHRRASSPTAPARSLYIDVAEAMITRPNRRNLSARVDKIMRHGVPAAIGAIIHLADRSSEALAAYVSKFLETQCGRSSVTTYSADAVARSPKIVTVPNDQAIVVVAGTVVSGRSVLGVSQVLRQVHARGPIVYIIGVARMASDKALRELRSNLAYGAYPSEHPVYTCLDVAIPDDRATAGSVWEREAVLIRQLAETESDASVVAALHERLAAIEAAASTEVRGLLNNLFLPPPLANDTGLNYSRALAVEPGFVFWPDFERGEGSQADVFWTISAVLHGLRDEQRGAARLRQHEHRRSVISPSNFIRYNDSVIQAALLRAAIPTELNFTQTDALSAQMKELVGFILLHADEEQGAAASEFLLALADRRLRLTDRHLSELLAPFKDHANGWVRTMVKKALHHTVTATMTSR